MTTANEPLPADPIKYQRKLFAAFENLFEAVTGSSVAAFEQVGEFSEALRDSADRISARYATAMRSEGVALHQCYVEGVRNFADARSVGGLKLVVGGGSRFYQTQFDCVRKMVLYADTILLPDPVLPWFEVDRSDERFRSVEMLHNLMWVLKLKPLIDADFRQPPVIVFPSFEKSLAAIDAETRNMEEGLVLSYFSHHLNRDFDSMADLADFAAAKPGDLLGVVRRRHLILGPGKESFTSVEDSLEGYREFITENRSDEFLEQLGDASDSQIALMAVFERLAPQAHLLENAASLVANPMLCFPSHWDYYREVSELLADELDTGGYLSRETQALARSLDHPTQCWLGNVPIEALVELRQRGENETLRRRLSDSVGKLALAQLGDLDRVAAEVSTGLHALLAEHDRAAREIESKYRTKYVKVAAGSWLTLAASLCPALIPFIGAAVPFAAATLKYVWDKLDELGERKSLSHSMLGVLASARRRDPE